MLDRALSGFTVVSALVLVAGGVAAAKKKPAPRAAVTASEAQKKESAKASFRQGELDYKLGRFEEALASFSAAYETLPLPAFLFNIAQCHRMMGNHERAVFFFEGFLREVPEAPNRKLVEDLLAESKKRLEVVQQEAAKNDELARREQELRRVEAEAQARLSEINALPVVAATAVAPPAPALWERWWFWATVGGVVLAGGAVGVALALGDRGTRGELPSGTLGTFDRRAALGADR